MSIYVLFGILVICLQYCEKSSLNHFVQVYHVHGGWASLL